GGVAVGGGDAGTGAGDWPSVVAVIPARDEAGMLPLTLSSLLAQGYPGELAVVLVDDGSADGTAAVAEALGQVGGTALKVIRGEAPPAGGGGEGGGVRPGGGGAGGGGYPPFFRGATAFRGGAVAGPLR